MSADELTYYRGRVGLHAILEALGIGRGDEVITQAYTCVAVPEAILAGGARPVYADVESDGLNIDPEAVRMHVSDATRAIVVQHTFGLPAAMPAIMAVARERGIPVIEDCCHTIAGRLGGEQLGRFGAAAFFSYEWGKPLVVGVGGSVRVNDETLASRLRAAHRGYRSPSLARQLKLGLQYAGFGAVYHPRLYWPVRAAFRHLSRSGAVEGNYNAMAAGEVSEEFRLDMAPMQRALLAVKRRGAARDTAHRRSVVDHYRKALGVFEGLFVEPDAADVVYARLPLRVRDKPRCLARAQELGVELAQWYTSPVHPFEGEALRRVGYEPGSCPRAEERCATVVSLPTHRRVSPRFVRRAAEFFREVA